MFWKEEKLVLFGSHQNVSLVYYLKTNQPKFINLNLDVPLLFLYSFVGKPDKYHQHIIGVPYISL